jgi:inosine-uridine nucleoside N-ribohydrolase
MARKVIFDLDPGIDDAVALCLALASDKLEVIAATATGGSVGPQQATRNVQAIIEQVDPRRWPRIGAAAADKFPLADQRNLHGPEGLGDKPFNVAELVHQHPAEKVLCDELRAAPGAVTIIALGPLTNIAAALQRDPEIAQMIGHLIIQGGTYAGPGNVSPGAEFNIYCDPEAADIVFRSPITKTLVPLDVSTQVVMTYNQGDQLLKSTSRTGEFLSSILPFAFRSYRQQLGMEGIFLSGAIATLLALQPELFETEPGIGEVETGGSIAQGMTVFDRRRHGRNQTNMDVAIGIDTAGALDAILRGLKGAE